MSRVYINGWGAVSPAGWTASDLLQPRGGIPAGAQPADEKLRGFRASQIPPPPDRPPWASHPRLRRASAISRHLVAASTQATERAKPDPATLGVLFAVFSGSVTYSRRFYEEAVRDPATASPLLFPETVFNAPASHLAAVLGAGGANYTLVGDTTGFTRALAMAAGMIRAGAAQTCLVAGAEELDWITCEALACFGRAGFSEGAGALLLSARRSEGSLELLAVSGEHLGAAGGSAAVKELRAAGWRGEYCGGASSAQGVPVEGLMAGAAWQWVRAAEQLSAGSAQSLIVATQGLLGSGIAGVLGAPLDGG